MNTPDVVIAGAGIIGLSSALELAAAGLRVTVVERAEAMAESSWAAAGMLAARDPENPVAIRDLADLSVTLYPEYLRLIEALAQVPVPLRSRQALQATRLGATFDRGALASGEVLSPSQAAAFLPGLATQGRQFLLLEEASLDPRDLCKALPRAARAVGVTLLEHTAVLGIEDGPAGVAIHTSDGTLSAAAFVNCCGAWSSDILAARGNSNHAPRGVEPSEIRPRKGQMVTVRHKGGLPCVLRCPEIYLVPRRGPLNPADDRIVIGATVEDAGFDKLVDPGAITSLLTQAAALWAPIADATVVEAWAGLRPVSPDLLPVLGNLSGMDGNLPSSESRGGGNCWIASGHYRNGILLAPATARVLAQLVRGLPTEIDLEAFDPRRFLLDRAALASNMA